MQGYTIDQLTVGQQASFSKTISESDVYMFAWGYRRMSIRLMSTKLMVRQLLLRHELPMEFCRLD